MERLKLALILILLSTPCFAATQTIDTTAVNLDGGTIDGTKIGSSSSADATFNTVEFNNGTNYDDRIITIMPATDGSSTEVQINNAIQVLKNKSTTGATGGKIILGRGAFFINNPIVIDGANIMIEGAGGTRGTRIQYNNSRNQNMIEITGTDTRGIYLRNLELYGNAENNTSGSAISWQANNSAVDADSRFENLFIIDFAEHGFVSEVAANRGMQFFNVRVLYCRKNGFQLASSDHNFIKCNSVANGWNGFMINAWNVRMVSCRADINNNNYTLAGGLIPGRSADDVFGYGYNLNGNNIILEASDTQANYTHGVYVNNATNVQLVGNRFEIDAADFGSGQTVAGSWSSVYLSENSQIVSVVGNVMTGRDLGIIDSLVDYGVTVAGAKQVTITNNLIDQMHADGIQIFGDAKDITIHDNTITNTLNSGDAIDITVPGDALNFDALNDQILVNNDSSDNATFGSTAMSYEVRFMARSMGENAFGRLFDKRGAGGSSGASLTTQSLSGNLFSLSFLIDRATTDTTSIIGNVSLYNWHHYVVSFDGTNAPTAYLDGIPVTATSSAGGSGSIVDDTGNNLYIGDRQGGDRSLDGQISLFRIFRNKALTAAEVRTLYAGGSVSGDTAEYLFTEGTGSTVADTSGGGNNGTITGATWDDGKTQMNVISIADNHLTDLQTTPTQVYGINVSGDSVGVTGLNEFGNTFYGNTGASLNNFPVNTVTITSGTLTAGGGFKSSDGTLGLTASCPGGSFTVKSGLVTACT